MKLKLNISSSVVYFLTKASLIQEVCKEK